MYRFFFLLLLLAGCQQDTNPAAKKVARIESAAAVSAKAPESHVYSIGSNELVAVDLKTSDGTGWVTTQRCYVWRDFRLNTASMSCPSEQAEEPAPIGGATFDHH